jgi:hypothetical protein
VSLAVTWPPFRAYRDAWIDHYTSSRMAVAVDSVAVSAPMREFLQWVAFRPRTHSDAMEAWGSHCPRFTQWEDALDAGLIELEAGSPDSSRVKLTPRGQSTLGALEQVTF